MAHDSLLCTVRVKLSEVRKKLPKDMIRKAIIKAQKELCLEHSIDIVYDEKDLYHGITLDFDSKLEVINIDKLLKKIKDLIVTELGCEDNPGKVSVTFITKY